MLDKSHFLTGTGTGTGKINYKCIQIRRIEQK